MNDEGLPDVEAANPVRFIRTSLAGLGVLAIVTGAGAGLGAIVFRSLIWWFTALLSGHPDYSAAGHTPNPWVPWLGPWFVVLAPAVAGLLYGPLIYRYAREARGSGVSEVMLAVAENGGRIRPAVAVVKSLASAICIEAAGRSAARGRSCRSARRWDLHSGSGCGSRSRA
jgi:CIC family chloride channel protein